MLIMDLLFNFVSEVANMSGFFFLKSITNLLKSTVVLLDF